MNIEEIKKRVEIDRVVHKTNYARVNSLFDNGLENDAFIIRGGHFHIRFNNGYEVSIFNSFGSYTDNYQNTHTDYEAEDIYSEYVEIAIIKNGYFHTRDFIKDNDDDVLGFVSADELIDILDIVSNEATDGDE